MDEVVLIRAREALERVELPVPALDEVCALADRRRARRAVATGAVALILVAGLAVPLFALRDLGHGRENGAAAGGDGISFAPAEGWYVAATGEHPADPEGASGAWASNEPLPTDGPLFATDGSLLAAGVSNPTYQISRDGIFITIWQVFPAPPGPVEPNVNFPSRELPLQLSEFQIRHEYEGQNVDRIPEYVLWATVEGRYLDVRVFFGRQDPTLEQLAAAQQELERLVVPPAPLAATGPSGPVLTGTTGPAPSGPALTGPSGGPRYLAPFLAGGEGWFTYASGAAPAEDATVAWASTIPIVESDLTYGAAIPPETIQALPADGFVITAETVTPPYDPTLGPFPYDGVTLDLGRAILRGPEDEEPEGDEAVLELSDEPVLVRVYFGTPTPSAALIEMAQRELDTLQLPPTCPFPGPGGYAVQLSVEEGAPGDIVTIAGLMPFQYEDGSYETSGGTRMIAWWNASPKDWVYLSSFFDVEPSPVIEGTPLIRLGEDGGNVCTFSIQFTVPDAPPGDYSIVVLQEGGDGSTMEGSLVFRVLSGG